MAGENRSAHPDIPGVPWWGAILIAVLGTLAGFALDTMLGHRELTSAFAALYLVGCLAAVLAVRQSGLFTAVVQPPLILFVAVPTAYYLFHSSEIHGAKDILINCGYPLIERFLLMFTTSVLVLLIGMARWYIARTGREVRPTAGTALLAGVGAKIATLLGRRDADDGAEDAKPARKHGIARPATSVKPPRPRRAGAPAAPTRARHARPPMDDPDGPPPPRRRYADHSRDDTPPQRRRPAPPRTGDPERPTRSDDRVRRYRTDDYPSYRPYEPYQPPPRRPAPPSTHHPISNVRYRGDAESTGDDGYRRPRPRN